jgi:hypothetical protein
MAARIASDYHKKAGLTREEAFNYLMRQDWLRVLREY